MMRSRLDAGKQRKMILAAEVRYALILSPFLMAEDCVV